MPVTQKDIARAVGVSQAIVSDVLQGQPRGRVSTETRQRIFETAQRLGYQPNGYARALRTRRSRQIAYVIAEADVRQHYAFGELALSGMASVLSEQEYQLVIKTTPCHEQAVTVFQDMFAAGACDGGLIRMLESRHCDLPALRQMDGPLVILGHCPSEDLTSLAFDAEGCARAALEHVARRGHKNVGFISTPDSVDYYHLISQVWDEIAPALGFDAQRWLASAPERQDGDALAHRWLSQTEAPTAILCLKCRPAVGVTSAALRLGKRIGHDLDLVVFGDPIFGEGVPSWLYEPGTWYFDNDQEAMGRRAARELLGLLQGDPSQGAIRVMPELRQVERSRT